LRHAIGKDAAYLHAAGTTLDFGLSWEVVRVKIVDLAYAGLSTPARVEKVVQPTLRNTACGLGLGGFFVFKDSVARCLLSRRTARGNVDGCARVGRVLGVVGRHSYLSSGGVRRAGWGFETV
jgi:hypothetical protein